jgi:hypothetical protein
VDKRLGGQAYIGVRPQVTGRAVGHGAWWEPLHWPLGVHAQARPTQVGRVRGGASCRPCWSGEACWDPLVHGSVGVGPR